MYSLSQAPLAPPRAAFRSFLLQAPGSEALRRPRESAAGSAARAGAATKCVGASGAGPAPNAVRPYKRLCGLCCRARSLDRGLRRVGGYSGETGARSPKLNDGGPCQARRGLAVVPPRRGGSISGTTIRSWPWTKGCEGTDRRAHTSRQKRRDVCGTRETEKIVR